MKWNCSFLFFLVAQLCSCSTIECTMQHSVSDQRTVCACRNCVRHELAWVRLKPFEPSDVAITQYRLVLLIIWSVCNAFDWIAWWNDAKPKRLFWGWYRGVVIIVSSFNASRKGIRLSFIHFSLGILCFCALEFQWMRQKLFKWKSWKTGCLLMKPSSNYLVRQTTKSTPHFSSHRYCIISMPLSFFALHNAINAYLSY